MRKLVLILTVLSLVLLGVMMIPVAADTAEEGCPGAPTKQLEGEASGRVAQSFSTVWTDTTGTAYHHIMTRHEEFTITGAPVCVNVHWWYPIESRGIAGYATEGVFSIYWLEPIPGVVEPPPPTPEPTPDPTPEPRVARIGDAVDGGFKDPYTGIVYSANGDGCTGAPSPQLTAGVVAEVAQLYSTMRLGVHSNEIVRVNLSGQSVTVVDGPFCATGINSPYNWYLVEFTNADGSTVTGWSTEGTDSVYWLKPQ